MVVNDAFRLFRANGFVSQRHEVRLYFTGRSFSSIAFCCDGSNFQQTSFMDVLPKGDWRLSTNQVKEMSLYDMMSSIIGMTECFLTEGLHNKTWESMGLSDLEELRGIRSDATVLTNTLEEGIDRMDDVRATFRSRLARAVGVPESLIFGDASVRVGASAQSAIQAARRTARINSVTINSTRNGRTYDLASLFEHLELEPNIDLTGIISHPAQQTIATADTADVVAQSVLAEQLLTEDILAQPGTDRSRD